MNKTISIIRIIILSTLALSAMILLSIDGMDRSLPIEVLYFFCIAAFFAFGRLYVRWSKTDPWIMAFDKMCDKLIDNPNPSQN